MKNNLSDNLTDGQYEWSILRHLNRIENKNKPKERRPKSSDDLQYEEIPF